MAEKEGPRRLWCKNVILSKCGTGPKGRKSGTDVRKRDPLYPFKVGGVRDGVSP